MTKKILIGIGIIAILIIAFRDSSYRITQKEYGEYYPYTIDNLKLKCSGQAVWVEDDSGNKYAVNGMAYAELSQKGDEKLKGYTTAISKNKPAVHDDLILNKGLEICR